ncbi:MAG: hypothetical protein P1Q69_03550 [Candidatus Thorarchaeota archaeon]|nr:hypothetical protein [Candidatus Thorarchaeota archaeon]
MIEFAFVLTAVVVAFGQGWPQVIQPLQVLGVCIIMTVLMLIFEEVCNDFEEKEKQHPGTYNDIQT